MGSMWCASRSRCTALQRDGPGQWRFSRTEATRRVETVVAGTTPAMGVDGRDRTPFGYRGACHSAAASVNPVPSTRGVHPMTYLVATDLPTAPAGERFRALLVRPGILQMPGAHNGMAALQAAAVGFEALYLSGAAMTASMGIPDLGMITVDEVCF